MDVTIEKEGTRTFVKFAGRVDTTNADQFQKDLAPLMDDQTPDFDIDCSGMDYTSSQGLRIFLMLQKSVSSKGGSMVLRNMNPQVREVFEITGFANIIRIL